MLSASSFFAVFGPTPHNADTGRENISPGHEEKVIWKTPPGFAYRGRDLRLELVLADADRGRQPGGREHGGPDLVRQQHRVVDGTVEVRLVPAPHLHRAHRKIEVSSMTVAEAAS